MILASPARITRSAQDLPGLRERSVYRSAMVVTARARRRVVAGLVAWSAVVVRVTLWPKPAPDDTFDVVRAVLAWLQERGVGLTYAVVEAVANVVMFVPFGVLVGLLLPRRWWAVALGALTSAAIELAQLAFLPSRVPTVQDVVMNTLGAAVGVALLAAYGARRARRTRTDDATTTTRTPDGRVLPQEDPAVARVEPV